MSLERSDLPKLLLTRPEPANARVLADCEAMMGCKIPAIFSPVLEIMAVGPWPDLYRYRSVILTSANAVRGDLSGLRAYCVGEQTAQAAERAGAQVAACALDAASLVAAGMVPDAPVLYLRGAHVSVDLAAEFSADACVVYDQCAHPLSEDALEALNGDRPVILPLFSPRMARLVAAKVSRPAPRLHVIGMSVAVAKAWKGALVEPASSGSLDVCEEPTRANMVSRIVASLPASLRDRTRGGGKDKL